MQIYITFWIIFKNRKSVELLKRHLKCDARNCSHVNKKLSFESYTILSFGKTLLRRQMYENRDYNRFMNDYNI